MKSFALFTAGVGLAQAYTVTNAKRFMNKNIDPIVVPGQYISHMHSFFGSDAVTVNTTTSAELQDGCSTAENPNDYSSYWFPTLYKVNTNGSREEVPLSRFSAYYVDIDKAEIAIPQNYRAVVGNAQAQTQADVPSLAGQSWFCEHGDVVQPEKDAAAFPLKGCPVFLQTLLLFHDCVNPDTLESAYSGTHNWDGDFHPTNRCPAGMFRMPRLRFSIRFDMRKILPDGWDGTAPLELSCGPSYCFHGDFINGWLPEAAENMLLANSKRDFAGVSGPAGRYNAGSVCGAEYAQDADPENGTAELEESRVILESGDEGDLISAPAPEATSEAAAVESSGLVSQQDVEDEAQATPTASSTPSEKETASSIVPTETSTPFTVPDAETGVVTCPTNRRRARRAFRRAMRSTRK